MNEDLKQLTPLIKKNPSVPNSININCNDDNGIYVIDQNGDPSKIMPRTDADFYGKDVVVNLSQVRDEFFNNLQLTQVLTNSEYLSVVDGNVMYGDNDHKYDITDLRPTIVPVLTGVADELIEQSSGIKFPDIEQVHEIRDNYNVSDYIIFDDCITRGKVNKISVGIKESPLYYDSKSITINAKNVYFDIDEYEYTKEDIKNINDDAYGTYVDVTITYRYDTAISDYSINKVTKRLQLCDSDRMTYVYHDVLDYGQILPLAYDFNYQGSSMQPSDEVEGNEAPIDVNGIAVDWQIMEQKPIKPFCIVYNNHRLVVYDLGVDGISEFYISSCIVYKVNVLNPKEDES